jgi:hypothetical protein
MTNRFGGDRPEDFLLAAIDGIQARLDGLQATVDALLRDHPGTVRKPSRGRACARGGGPAAGPGGHPRRGIRKWTAASFDVAVLQSLPEMPNNYGEPTAFMVIRRTGLPLAAPNWFAKIDPSATCARGFPTSEEAGAGVHGSPAPLVQLPLR